MNYFSPKDLGSAWAKPLHFRETKSILFPRAVAASAMVELDRTTAAMGELCFGTMQCDTEDVVNHKIHDV